MNRRVILYTIFIAILCTTIAVSPASASTEEIGVWDDISHDEEFEFNTEDGVNRDQFEKIVKRSMARVEVLRDRPFKQTVPVEIYTRERFKVSEEIVYNRGYSTDDTNYLNEYWNALFIVPDSENAVETQREVTVENVEAYYNPTKERIVFVSDSNSNGLYQIQESVLIQELTHAMQDQYEGLWTDNLQYKYTDEQLTKSMFIEGEAATIVNSFNSYCSSGRWDCLRGNSTVSQFTQDRNQGILYSLYFPYAVGEEYVYSQDGDSLIEKIESGYENVPTQSRQYLYPDSAVQEPVELFLQDMSSEEWELYSEYNWDGRETVGQSVVYTMLWYQNEQYNMNIPVPDIEGSEFQNESHNYRSELTKDLLVDSLAVYNQEIESESDSEETQTKQGYVWKHIWMDSESAKQFSDVYTTILREHGGQQKQLSEIYDDQLLSYVNGEVDSIEAYTLPEESGFTGEYVVIQDRNTVLIINADSTEGINELRNLADDPTFIQNYQPDNLTEEDIEEEPEEETPLDYVRSNILSFILIFSMTIAYIVYFVRGF